MPECQLRVANRGQTSMRALGSSLRFEPDIETKRDPVGVLAENIAAVDNVDVDVLHRREPQPKLCPRLSHARGLDMVMTGEAEHLADQRQRLYEVPLEAGTVGDPMKVFSPNIQPTSVQV